MSTVGLNVAILGGGPAALTCGYYLNLAGCKVSLFNKEDQPGGKLWLKSESNPVIKVGGSMMCRAFYQADLILKGI